MIIIIIIGSDKGEIMFMEILQNKTILYCFLAATLKKKEHRNIKSKKEELKRATFFPFDPNKLKPHLSKNIFQRIPVDRL